MNYPKSTIISHYNFQVFNKKYQTMMKPTFNQIIYKKV